MIISDIIHLKEVLLIDEFNCKKLNSGDLAPDEMVFVGVILKQAENHLSLVK
jgi:hypothetical protein